MSRRLNLGEDAAHQPAHSPLPPAPPRVPTINHLTYHPGPTPPRRQTWAPVCRPSGRSAPAVRRRLAGPQGGRVCSVSPGVPFPALCPAFRAFCLAPASARSGLAASPAGPGALPRPACPRSWCPSRALVPLSPPPTHGREGEGDRNGTKTGDRGGRETQGAARGGGEPTTPPHPPRAARRERREGNSDGGPTGRGQRAERPQTGAHVRPRGGVEAWWWVMWRSAGYGAVSGLDGLGMVGAGWWRRAGEGPVGRASRRLHSSSYAARWTGQSWTMWSVAASMHPPRRQVRMRPGQGR